MRGVLLKTAMGLSLAGAITTALAQERPYAPRMTCAAAASLVARAGGIVIGTGPSTYDRFVSDDRFCQTEETTVATWTNTADNPQCLVGYRCKDRFDESDDE